MTTVCGWHHCALLFALSWLVFACWVADRSLAQHLILEWAVHHQWTLHFVFLYMCSGLALLCLFTSCWCLETQTLRNQLTLMHSELRPSPPVMSLSTCFVAGRHLSVLPCPYSLRLLAMVVASFVFYSPSTNHKGQQFNASSVNTAECNSSRGCARSRSYHKLAFIYYKEDGSSKA